VRYLARVEGRSRDAGGLQGRRAEAAAEIARPRDVKPVEVYEEEARIQHNSRALSTDVRAAASAKQSASVRDLRALTRCCVQPSCAWMRAFLVLDLTLASHSRRRAISAAASRGQTLQSASRLGRPPRRVLR